MEGSSSSAAGHCPAQVVQMLESFSTDTPAEDVRTALTSNFRSKELRAACTRLNLRPQSEGSKNTKEGYIELLCEFHGLCQEERTVDMTDAGPPSPSASDQTEQVGSEQSFLHPEGQQSTTHQEEITSSPTPPQLPFFYRQDDDIPSRTNRLRTIAPVPPARTFFRIRPDRAIIESERPPKRVRQRSSEEEGEDTHATTMQDQIQEFMEEKNSGAARVTSLALAVRSSTEAIRSLRQTRVCPTEMIDKAEQKLKPLIVKWMKEMEALGQSN